MDLIRGTGNWALKKELGRLEVGGGWAALSRGTKGCYLQEENSKPDVGTSGRRHMNWESPH